MTGHRAEPLRIALLYHDYLSPQRSAEERYVHELALALLQARHQVHVLSTHRGERRRTLEDGVVVIRVRRLSEALLRRRGFTGPLTQVPVSVGALVSGGFDAVDAFSTPDALTARTWQRLTGRPAVFTCVEGIRRESLADRRLRLRLLQRAVAGPDAVIAATAESSASLGRWLALDVPVLDSLDVEGHERLYRGLPAPHEGERGPG